MKELSLMYFLNLALRWLWVIILVMIVFGASAFGYCEFLATPQYKATASVLVTNGAIMQDATEEKDTVNSTDISASISLIDTVMDILKTPEIFKELSNEIDNRYSYGALKSRFTVTEKSNRSMFVDISFIANSPEEATELVNKFAALTPDYITKFVPYSYVAIAANADNASLVYPKTTTFIMMAALVGAAITYIVVFIIDSLDHAVLGEKDFASKYDIPIIGTVPDFESVGVIASSNQANGGKYNAY